jgi:hypothetical protein
MHGESARDGLQHAAGASFGGAAIVEQKPHGLVVVQRHPPSGKDFLDAQFSDNRPPLWLKFSGYALNGSPLEYLTQWRMYKAGAMIRSNNMSFSVVASAGGYGSESSFSRVFKREMGVAPREYRRKCALLQSPIEE